MINLLYNHKRPRYAVSSFLTAASQITRAAADMRKQRKSKTFTDAIADITERSTFTRVNKKREPCAPVTQRSARVHRELRPHGNYPESRASLIRALKVDRNEGGATLSSTR